MSKSRFVKSAAMIAREHTDFVIHDAVSIMTRSNRGAFNLWLGFLDQEETTEGKKLIGEIRKAVK